MKRQIITTADGSTTIHLPEWDEQYHSKHGAVQEAYHVFIKYGLHHCCHLGLNQDSKIAILEIGFGTGLNALITLMEAEKLNLKVDYVGVEAYPISMDEVLKLNYPDMLDLNTDSGVFKTLHDISWEEHHDINFHFSLTKQKKPFRDIDQKDKFNLIYFDAFGARVQPELWTQSIFKIMFEAPKG